MSEKIPTSKPKLSAEEIEREENERYEAWVAEHPVAEVLQDFPETCAEKVAECEAMMDSFEKTYDLNALRAITQFASEKERKSSTRQPALDALAIIFKRLKYLNRQGALQKESRDALGARYEILSQAVGNIIVDKNGEIFDVVVHDRPTPFPS